VIQSLRGFGVGVEKKGRALHEEIKKRKKIGSINNLNTYFNIRLILSEIMNERHVDPGFSYIILPLSVTINSPISA
jgi:hypothetical protein